MNKYTKKILNSDQIGKNIKVFDHAIIASNTNDSSVYDLFYEFNDDSYSSVASYISFFEKHTVNDLFIVHRKTPNPNRNFLPCKLFTGESVSELSDLAISYIRQNVDKFKHFLNLDKKNPLFLSRKMKKIRENLQENISEIKVIHLESNFIVPSSFEELINSKHLYMFNNDCRDETLLSKKIERCELIFDYPHGIILSEKLIQCEISFIISDNEKHSLNCYNIDDFSFRNYDNVFIFFDKNQAIDHATKIIKKIQKNICDFQKEGINK